MCKWEMVRATLPLAAALLMGCAASAPQQQASAGWLHSAGMRHVPLPRVKTSPDEQPEARLQDGEYIEYRNLGDLGQITIADHAVRGEKSTDYLQSHSRELVKKGIYPCTGDKTHFYRRTEQVGEHIIETAIVIEPPGGDGEDAALGAQHVLIRIDGHIKVACTVGASTDGLLWVGQISIFPEDETLEIIAMSSEGQELTLPEEWLSFDSPIVITDGTFFEDIPDIEEPPVRV